MKFHDFDPDTHGITPEFINNELKKLISEMSEEERQAMLKRMEQDEKILKGDLPRPKPEDCDHHLRQGDNYGETCQLCGKHLYGFGFRGVLNYCVKHLWVEGMDYSECVYCAAIKEKSQAGQKSDDGQGPDEAHE